MNDTLGRALYDYYHKTGRHKLWIHNRYGLKEAMPVATYFRAEDDMPDLEWVALNNCHGNILDIGAGAGCHSLILQERGFNVTALEISPLAADVMRQRGVNQVIEADIFNHTAPTHDTLLMLMNGVGFTGTLDKLRLFLRHAKTLLNTGGQMIFDSSDVAYLYEGILPQESYYGEIWYRYEYKRQKNDWFSWLYVDEKTLYKIAAEEGWETEVLYEDEFGQYLVKMVTG